MVFKPYIYSLKVVYRLRESINLRDIVEDKFPITIVKFKDGKMYNTETGKVLVDLTKKALKPKPIGHNTVPEGLISKSYAYTSNLMYYSEGYRKGIFVPYGTTCSLCGEIGPSVHKHRCESPRESSLIINSDGIKYIDKNKLAKLKNKTIIYYTDVFTNMKPKKFVANSLNLEYSYNMTLKDSEYNKSSLLSNSYPSFSSMTSESDYNTKSKSSSHSSSSQSSQSRSRSRSYDSANSSSLGIDSKREYGPEAKGIMVRITATKNELHVGINGQPWNIDTNYYKDVENQLKEYLYPDPEVYLAQMALHTSGNRYNFDKLFEDLLDSKYNLITKRPKKRPAEINGLYSDDPIDEDKYPLGQYTQKLFIEYDNVYYSVYKNIGDGFNTYDIYIYNKIIDFFEKLPYHYILKYYSTSGYQIQFNLDKDTELYYTPRLKEKLNKLVQNLSECIDHYAELFSQVPIKNKKEIVDAEKLFDGTVLGRIPPKMRKIRKKEGLADGVRGLEVNLFDPDKKQFGKEIYIVEAIDPDDELRVMVKDKDGGVSSELIAFLRPNELPTITCCRDNGGMIFRPEPYSFMHGQCPEGIINMIVPYGEQSSYDARFYPCCKNVNVKDTKDFIMYGFNDFEREAYLIPDTVRTDSNYNKLIDSFTGTLDPYYLSMTKGYLVVKNNGFTAKKDRHGNRMKYVLAKFIGHVSKAVNKDGPQIYAVSVNGVSHNITGLDLHPVYREYRNFRGLVGIFPNELDQRSVLLSFLEEENPEYKIFFDLDFVTDVKDMHKRNVYLNRLNLKNLTKGSYSVEVVPKSSIYAEIKYIGHKDIQSWAIVDVYGRGFVLKNIGKVDIFGDKNKVFRGYLNYKYKNISKNYFLTDKERQELKVEYYIIGNNDYRTLNKKDVLEMLPENVVLRELSYSPRMIAKYLKQVHNDPYSDYFLLSNCDILIYNSQVSYQVTTFGPKNVVLRIKDIEKISTGTQFLMAFKDGTEVTSDYHYGDNDGTVPYTRFKKGDYVGLRINCINGNLKKYSYIGMYHSSESEYDKNPDIKIYVENLLYQIDRKMFAEESWYYSELVNGTPDITLEDDPGRHCMKMV